jgi:hypothetical protein
VSAVKQKHNEILLGFAFCFRISVSTGHANAANCKQNNPLFVSDRKSKQLVYQTHINIDFLAFCMVCPLLFKSVLYSHLFEYCIEQTSIKSQIQTSDTDFLLLPSNNTSELNTTVRSIYCCIPTHLRGSAPPSSISTINNQKKQNHWLDNQSINQQNNPKGK